MPQRTKFYVRTEDGTVLAAWRVQGTDVVRTLAQGDVRPRPIFILEDNRPLIPQGDGESFKIGGTDEIVRQVR